MEGLTSSNVTEKENIVDILIKATAGTGWMHESFSVMNPHKYTRSWFCWADSLFGTFVLLLFFFLLTTSKRNCSSHTSALNNFLYIHNLAELVLSLTDSCPDPTHKYEVYEWRDPNVVFGGEYSADQ
jgi:uncharacterized protein